MKTKKPKERQYELKVEAVFVVTATSLAEAKSELEDTLMGQNTVSVKVGDGQVMIPQMVIEEVEEECLM
jgi:hypothetical protein